jgi:Tfp pilus assembly protein PilF
MVRPLLCLILLLFLAGLSASVKAQSFDRWLRDEFRLFRVYPRLDRAQRFYSRQQYDAARAAVTEVLRIDPQNLQGLRLIIEICRSSGDFQCIRDYSVSMVSLPDLRAVGAYYLALDASREGDVASLGFWANLALSESRTAISSEERSLLVEMLRNAYESESPESSLTDHANDFLVSLLDIGAESQSSEEVVDSIGEMLEEAPAIEVLQIEDELLAIHYLQSEGEFQSALDLAQSLPEISTSYGLVAELLEQLGRHAEAAKVLLENASEAHMRSPEFWQYAFFLLGESGQRQGQINLLVRARPYILGSEALLQMASMLFLEEVNLSVSNEATESDVQGYEFGLMQIQRLLDLINNYQDDVSADIYRPFRLDAEIMLAGNLLARGEEQLSWELIQKLLADESMSFVQLAALSPIISSSGHCPEVIELYDSTVISVAQQLALISCYHHMGSYANAFSRSQSVLQGDTLPRDAALELRRNMGYLALQMNDARMALGIWEALLDEEENSQIALSTAYVALTLNDHEKAEALLERVDQEQLSPAGRVQFWQSRARLASLRGELQAAIDAYQQALLWDDGSINSWQQLVQLAEQTGQLELAQQGWKKILQLQPDDPVLNGAYAYYLTRQEMAGATDQFRRASALDPDNNNLRRDLAFALLGSGEREEAVTVLRSVIADNLEDDNQRLYQDRELLSNIEKKWIFEVSDVLRMDEEPAASLNPGLRNSSYRGYGSLSATYQPDFGVDENSEQRLFLTSRMYWGNPDKSARVETENAILAVGARYKISKRHAIFASAEQLIGIGSQARDDTLLRLSGSFFRGLAWPFENKSWTYQNIYLDAAYFTRSEVEYATVEWERGKAFRLGGSQSNLALMPYFRLGAAANNDNVETIHETRVDAGIGLSLLSRGFNDSYIGHQLSTRISLAFIRKIAGNTRDTQSIQLRFGFRF